MSALWQKVRPHVLAWHMLPCLVMLTAAVGVAIATGQPSRVLGAVACMVMMLVMMGAIGGHNHGGHEGSEGTRPRGPGGQS